MPLKAATRPCAVLSGDTLFIGDVGRPDLRASLGWSATDLGRLLYTSLHTKLLPLPDATLLYPAHGAGSLCGKNLSSETVSTIGAERRTNYALQPMSPEAFLALVTADQPEAPAYFTYDAVLNASERPTLETALKREVTPLSVDRVMELAEAGATLLDVRDPAEFAHRHLRGSINIGLAGQYATWAGTLLDRDKPIVIIAEPGRETRGGGTARPDRVRPGRRVSGRRSSGPRGPARSAPSDGADERPGACGGTDVDVVVGAAAAGRSRAWRATAEIHRRQHQRAAEPASGAADGASARPAPVRLLRGRLSFVDRRQPAPA